MSTYHFLIKEFIFCGNFLAKFSPSEQKMILLTLKSMKNSQLFLMKF
jgi:hypothetical protein